MIPVVESTSPLNPPPPPPPPLNHSVAVESWSMWIPREKKDLADWSEDNIVLSSEYSARASNLKLYRWQREPFDCFTNPRVEEITICSAVQMFKCLDIRTPLPTPTGWVDMESVQVGDTLYDERGTPSLVTAVSPIYTGRECYRITFDDGSEICTDDGHHWSVFDVKKSNGLKLVDRTTGEMAKWYRGNRKRKSARYRIPCAQPLQTPIAPLPIDPYVFGCWLGDGTSGAAELTTDLRDNLLDEIKATGFEHRIVSTDKRRRHVAKVHLGNQSRGKLTGFRVELRKLGVLGNKHIPAIYLRASIEQRRSLLQGILDTDGTPANKGGGVVITQKNLKLAADCRELARSLGYKPTLTLRQSSIGDKDCGTVATIYFTAYAEERPFRLARKANQMRGLNDRRRITEAKRRSIVHISRVKSRPVKCLSIDSPSRLYLAGEGMTPTHNTLFIQAGLSYTIAEEPGPCMIVQPKELDAKAFSKERLTPMIRDCAALRGLIADSDKEGNTLLYKEFPGGSVMLVGSNAPGNMSRRSNKIVWFDEVDKYPASAGREGDVLTLGRERTITYMGKRKIVQTCSPTVAGQSRIWSSYQNSDMRRPWVPCWQCGTMQVLNFRDGVKFDTSLAPALQPATAYYQCINRDCLAHWNDEQRWRACERTEWRAERPFRGHAGFWINHLYSPHKTLALIVKDFLNAKDNRQQLQAFVNTNLAEVWQDEGSSPNAELMYARREDYPHSGEAVVPKRALFLTAAVDVQDNRLEVEVAGWGRGRERWSVGYFVIQEQDDDGTVLPSTHVRLWERLDQEILQALWQHEGGRQLPILCMCVDTGYKPKPVYDFAAKHARISHTVSGIKLTALRTVVPVKGDDDPLRIISKISKEDASRKRQNVRIISVGTHCAKQEIFDILNHIRPHPAGRAVPQCYHTPMYDMEYFNMLAAEIRVVHEDDGSVEYVKKPNSRNEALDLAVYNRAAAAIVGIDRFTEAHWQQMEEQLGVVHEPEPEETGLEAENANSGDLDDSEADSGDISGESDLFVSNAGESEQNPPAPLPARPPDAPQSHIHARRPRWKF